ncbi:MAG TPA: hypothetical protein VL096_17755 [Pirellulaceae bacterium]|nr:hypothetical protein [Pirellulaceae bacterium]
MFATMLRNSAGAAEPTKRPPWAAIEKLTKWQLSTRVGYLPGDILSRSDVEAVLDQIKHDGWEVPNRADLLKNTLDDGHFVVKELRTPAGVKFSRAVMKDPNVFDRLDRLSEFSGGHKLIHTIVHLPDGTQLMLKHPTPGMNALTELLPKQANGFTPKDKDFNKPTGKIYNETELLTALNKSYRGVK